MYCDMKRNNASLNEIGGVYASEYSFEIIHPETGVKVGTRKIRDTIYIRRLEEEYEIANCKWMRNDYDHNGWRDMKHSENRPFSTYQSKYNTENNSLFSREGKDLRFQHKDGSLYGPNGVTYKRIEK